MHGYKWPINCTCTRTFTVTRDARRGARGEDLGEKLVQGVVVNLGPWRHTRVQLIGHARNNM